MVLALLMCLLLAAAVEVHLGRPTSSGPAETVEDPAGRRMLLVLLDSLAWEDVQQVPALVSLQARGTHGKIEPCMERITYVCVKEALTGRPAFSLFGVLRNFGVGSGDPGPNLLRQARAIGRRVSMISGGDLPAFGRDADEDLRLDHDQPAADEQDKVLAATRSADIVFYHYIWHDGVAHHYRRDSQKYKANLVEMDRVLGVLQRGLPLDMDLVVIGDHGHGNDGRHVQGMDIPTTFAALSPNLRPGDMGDLPITAYRSITGAVTGLYASDTQWAPEWADWLGAPVGAEARRLVGSGPGLPEPPGFPWLVVLVAMGGLALVARSHSPRAALAVGVLGAIPGLSFQVWLERMHFPSGGWRVHTFFWAFPLLAWLGTLAYTRALARAWGVVAGLCVVAMLGLYPVMHHYGVLKNAAWIMGPGLLAGALVIARDLPRARAAVVLGLALLSVWLLVELTDFKVFNIEIVRYRALRVFRDGLIPGALGAAIAAGAVQAALDRRLLLVALAAVGASGLIDLPEAAHGVLFAAFAVATVWPGRHRATALCLSLAWAAPHVFKDNLRIGVFALLAAVTGGLWVLGQAPPAHRRAAQWSAAVLVLVGGYLSFAWTFGSAIAGVDFSFAMAWFPGRLHTKLWWLVGLAMLLKALAPAILLPELARRHGPAGLPDCIGAFALFRVVIVAVFATGWLVAEGEASGGLRMASILQDGLFWALLGVTLMGSERLARPKAIA